MYVASVCFKCFIYFFRRTLQACLFGCCICFTHRLQVFIYILHMFCSSFSSVFWIFFSSVLDACFKYFICLHTYVVNVLYECFNSKSGVAHVAMAPVAGGQRLAARLRLLPRAFLGRCASPSPPFPSLPFPSLYLTATVRARAGSREVWMAPHVGGRRGRGESSRQRRIRPDEAHGTKQEWETESSRGDLSGHLGASIAEDQFLRRQVPIF
jgi:hypothetical protein